MTAVPALLLPFLGVRMLIGALRPGIGEPAAGAPANGRTFDGVAGCALVAVGARVALSR
jgi:hypothetical protein